MKRNKTPQNVDVARQINLRKNRGEKYTWVPCIVCGDLCPQQIEGFYAQFDEVHVTCRYEPEYVKRIKELEKLRKQVETPSSLF